MFDLQHLILFGLSENKLEWYDNHTACRLPFPTRTQAEAAFLRCAESLARWQGLEAPLEREGERWWAETNGFKLELLARVVDFDMPISGEALLEFHHREWSPDLWPRPQGTPPGGGSYYMQWCDARMHVNIHVRDLSYGTGGKGFGRLDVALGDLANIQPDAAYYRPERKGCQVGDYFVGAPDLIVEVLAPATAAEVRGPRADLFARAGIPFFWVAVPETDTLETWTLEGSRYRMTTSYRDGEHFIHPLFPGCEIEVNALLDSQLRRLRKRAAEAATQTETPPIRGSEDSTEEDDSDESPFKFDSNTAIPLHILMLGGHPGRRYEVIDGRAPCIAAFQSEAVAKQRFREWVEEISRWEGAPVTVAASCAQAPHFELRQEGPRVSLDVLTSLDDYRAILDIYFSDGVWREYHEALERAGSKNSE
ncbi:MAG: Uma2 family endonuclease [Armatimonadota bacterium]|nr:Uma2 family endonuclease [Armatimonadota bacterium]